MESSPWLGNNYGNSLTTRSSKFCLQIANCCFSELIRLTVRCLDRHRPYHGPAQVFHGCVKRILKPEDQVRESGIVALLDSLAHVLGCRSSITCESSTLPLSYAAAERCSKVLVWRDWLCTFASTVCRRPTDEKDRSRILSSSSRVTRGPGLGSASVGNMMRSTQEAKSSPSVFRHLCKSIHRDFPRP